jgi:DNA repair protein RadC
MEISTSYMSVRTWAEEDRPREKLLIKGKSVLSDAELIAILIGSGTVSLSAVDVSKLILQSVNNDLNQLARLTIKDLVKVKGIGEAKAITIISALELGRRRKNLEPEQRAKIVSSSVAYEIMKPHLTDLPYEEFWLILLNRANEVIRKERVSAGGVAGTVVDPKVVFKIAIEHLASAVILVHNHPSGQIKASQEDKLITQKLKESGNLLDIPVLDHIIFTDHGYMSFVDEGLL